MSYWIFHFIDRYAGIPLVRVLSVFKRAFSGKSEYTGAKNERKRILLLKLSMMGDTVLLIPALRAIRRAEKNARVTMICSEINECVLRQCGYIDELVVINTKKLLNPFYLYSVVRKTRGSYDAAVDFEQWFRFSALLIYFLRPKFTAGFSSRGQYRHFLFDAATPLEYTKHAVENYFDLIGKINILRAGRELEMPVDETELVKAKQKLRSAGINEGEKFCVIHPGSSRWRQKQWPTERYAAVSDRLIETYGVKIVLTGGESEKQGADNILKNVKEKKSVISLAGELSFQELACVLKLAEMLICGNTGVMHLASAAGTPIVHISGPVNEKLWGPWQGRFVTVSSGIPCAPCVNLGFEYACGDRKCMNDISAEKVVEAAKKM